MSATLQGLFEAILCWALGGLLFTVCLGLCATIINATGVENNAIELAIINLLFDTPALYLLVVGLRFISDSDDQDRGGNY